MKNQVFKALLYMLISTLLSCILALIIGKLYGFGFFENLFWIGIVIVAVGGIASITGQASGSRILGGNESQYQSFANIESIQVERKLTNYYANFKKHAVFDPRISGFGAILSGLMLIIIGYHFSL